MDWNRQEQSCACLCRTWTTFVLKVSMIRAEPMAALWFGALLIFRVRKLSRLTTPRLTIVMPLKGRELFTLRFLWHANREGLPYRFIIADGQVDPRLADLLELPREIFPDLWVDYFRYEDDVSFHRYFRKMADVVQKVQSPYVMLVDNDDFLVSSGLERSMDFPDANPGYVCCGGGIAGFALYSRPIQSFGGALGLCQ